MHLSSVLLPDPFAPTMPKNSPAWTSNETPFRAQNSSYCARRPRRMSGLQVLVAFVEQPEPLPDVVDHDRRAGALTAPR